MTLIYVVSILKQVISQLESTALLTVYNCNALFTSIISIAMFTEESNLIQDHLAILLLFAENNNASFFKIYVFTYVCMLANYYVRY